MAPASLRFRQVHLDFHTGPAIPAVGTHFDPEQFADRLARAHVNSITCFARCHHGYLYYNSRRNPERLHPHLTNASLLLEQIQACHERGIRVPIYTTVQWDEYTADRHREWLCIDETGREVGTPPFEPGFYRNLDVLHPGYREWLREHVREMLTTLPVDGLFFDICQVQPSAALHWVEAMDAAGLDPTDNHVRQAFAARVMDEWELEMTEFVHSLNADCTIFYNSGHIGPRHRPSAAAYTHYEIESLPSGGWGYLHFPQTMRYARGLGKDCLAMTGKFHTSWGDFSSYKNRAALEYECFNALALGAQCGIGDQLPPNGQLDEATYELIGGVYEQVEAKEPWCSGAKPVSEIAVLTPEAFVGQESSFVSGGERNQPAAMGAVRMLTELRQQFDLVDQQSDLAPYSLVVLPDAVPVDDDLAQRLSAFVEAGGAVLASFASGLAPGSETMNFGPLGVVAHGLEPLYPSFLVAGPELSAGLPPAPLVMYQRGMSIEAGPSSQVLATRENPYHNRTWREFCSHGHTPNSGRGGGPAVVAAGNCIYFAHPIFSLYADCAPLWCKQLLANALAKLLPQPLVAIDGPSSLQCSLTEQAAHRRRILHLLHYVPERRGHRFDTIEDVLPLYELPVKLRSSEAPTSVRLVPDGSDLAFTFDDGQIRFIVPELWGHAMVEVT